MDYSGHHIVAHHPGTLSDLQVFRILQYRNSAYHLDDPAEVPVRENPPEGWHVLEVGPGMALELGEWFEEIARETRAPVMIVSVFDGVLCTVRGFEPGPRAGVWAARLHAASAPERYPVLKDWQARLVPAQPPEWARHAGLLSGAAALEAVAGWSAAAGGEADRDGLAALLAREPERFGRDVVFRLLDLLGLGGRVEPAPYPHDVVAWDDPVKLERSMAALQPGRCRALTCGEHQDCFAQVRMRPEGDYVIEYREDKPAVLYQTLTPSLEKVVEAMNAWARGDVFWRDEFVWTGTEAGLRGQYS